MKNLESYDVQIMDTKEVQETNGGILFTLAVCIALGTAAMGGHYIYESTKG